MQSGDRVDQPPTLFRPPKLFSGMQLLVAALFGLPVTVALLASLNFRRLGEGPRANKILLAGVLISAGVVAAVALLPDSFARLMPLVASIGTWQWIRHAQRSALSDLAQNRDRRASWWQAIGYAAAVTLVSTLVAAGVYAGLGVETSSHVAIGDGRKVYYSNGASEADARSLGEVLVRTNALPSGVTRVYVGKSDADYVVSIVLSENWDDPDVERHYGELRRAIEKNAFAPTKIRLLNDWLWPKRTIGP